VKRITKEHIVNLTEEVRTELQSLVRSGTRSVRVACRAQILLKSDVGLIYAVIAAHVGCSERTVAEVHKRFCQGGWERAVFEAPRSGRSPKFSAAQRQQLIALAYSIAPKGHARWTLELLSEKATEQVFVDSVSKSEVSLWLHEHTLKPRRKKAGAFPR
jgi:transposase